MQMMEADIHELAKALSAPKTPDQIKMALNASDDVSPYKKTITTLIIEGAVIEDIVKKLLISLKENQAKEQARYQIVIRDLKKDLAAEKQESKQAAQYAAETQAQGQAAARHEQEQKKLAVMLKELDKDSPVIKQQQEIVARTEILKEIDTAWAKRQQTTANNFCENFKEKLPIKLTEESEARLKKAFKTAEPTKLIKLNKSVLDKETTDPNPEKAKLKLDDCIKTMAYKGEFLERLQVYSELIHMQKKTADAGVVSNEFVLPSMLGELRKEFPIASSVEKNMSLIKEALVNDRALQTAEVKLAELVADNNIEERRPHP